MKIRHILLLLTMFLGTALLVAVSVQIRTEVLDYLTAQRLVASNSLREQLLLSADALARERSRTYALLVAPNGEGRAPEALSDARRRVDSLLAAAEAQIKARADYLRDPARSLASLAQLSHHLDDLRAQVDASLAIDQQRSGTETAPRWFQEATRIIEELNSFRLTLLQQERPQDPSLRAEAVLRTYASLLSESIARNQALMTRALGYQAGANNLDLQAIGYNAGRAGLAWEMIESQLAAPLSGPVREAISSTRDDYNTTFAPLQQSTLAALLGKVRSAITAEQWYGMAERSLQSVTSMQQELLGSSRVRLEAELNRARQTVVLWSALLLGGIIAVVASILVVRTRIVRPLEGVSSAMLRLADNDLSTPLPRLHQSDEIGEMSDALRVFKANAIRRQRTQNEKQMLHGRLKDAYRQLRKDLEAAAVIQSTMLPAAATLGDVRYRGLFRPSSLIAGDTYNVLRRSDGGIGFFQVDVAGHGAPAALVSVACHHTLSQAILTRTQDMRLEEIVAQINNDWPEDLPYFTMVLGEIDARMQRATILQAGHPSPLLIRRDGAVELVGDGGFPVGMLATATYETLELDFGPGDRLLIYSDGVVEAESQEGENFSEARLRELVRENAREPTPLILDSLDETLRKWRRSETLDDDLSVLMLERLNERTPANALL